MTDKEKLKLDAGLAYLPTDLTYELRLAVSGHRADEFLSWGYQWTDKPHRLVFAACCEAEALADENARLHDIAIFLFGVLDDIDTASDEAKDNHEWYRKRVEHLHHKRFEVMETDGYNVKVK